MKDSILEHDISILSVSEEYSFIFGHFFLCPIFAVLAIFIFAVIWHNLKHDASMVVDDHNKNTNAGDTRTAAICALISIVFSIFVYFAHIFLTHDFFIPWDFSAFNYHYCDIADFFIDFSYAFMKVFFYAAFTFHVLRHFHLDADDSQSHSDQNNQIQRQNNMQAQVQLQQHVQQRKKKRRFLKIWMYCASIAFLILMLVYFVDDASAFHWKEIGRLPTHNIYSTMELSHEGADYAHIAFILIIVVDMLYFGVLLYFYTKQLSSDVSTPNSFFSAVRGLVLVSFACILLWISAISIAIQLPINWCTAPLDITSDGIAIFLTFDFNTKLYLSVCGCCHRSVSQMCFKGKGYQYQYEQDYQRNRELQVQQKTKNDTEDTDDTGDSNVEYDTAELTEDANTDSPLL